VIIGGSFWRKAILTAVAVAGFVAAYEVTMLDSRFAIRQTAVGETAALPSPGARLSFLATAYCKGVTTASGVPVQAGIAAADPEILPVGSVVQIESLPDRHNGIYTIMDTGPAVQGRQVDIYMWSCNEALQFGRRLARLTVLRLGWSPRATAPGFLERMFKRPERQPEPLPSRPLPQTGN
jgi:3D (Asp-Asp-Asp) domain-containing protein